MNYNYLMVSSEKNPRRSPWHALFSSFFLLAFLLIPFAAGACGHLYYESRAAKTCSGVNVGYSEIWDVKTCCSSCRTGSCCSCYRCDDHIRTCEAWQIAVTAHTSGQGGDWGVCQCKKECLESPYQISGNPEYYDDPVNKSTQNPKNIKLPVVLAWKDVNGWKNDGKFVIGGGAPSVNYGPQSYIIEIQDTVSESGIDNLVLTKKQKTNPDIVTEIGSKKAYYKIITEDDKKDWAYFNSRDAKAEGTCIWPCFFNSSHTYRWRVRPCCDAFGSDCKAFNDDEGWWEFTTSTSPEMISPLDPDWNGPASISESFKNLVESKNPLKWCSAMLPEKAQIKDQPVKYAGSYQLYVTSNEENTITGDIVGEVIDVATNFWSWITGGSPEADQAAEKTHSLSIINGDFIYNLLPNKSTGDVDTWFPAQSRGDLAYFTRGRTYTWKLRSCVDTDTFDCYEDDNDSIKDNGNPEYSQQWKIATPPDDTIDPPAALSPKDVSSCGSDHDCACDIPVGFPLAVTWSIPAGANSFVYETTIDNFTGERKTIWNSVPNNGKEFDNATIKLLSLDNAALKLDTVYRWRARSCAEFDSGRSNPKDCDAWSSDSVNTGYAFCTTGRPPKTSSMTPGGLTSDISFPQNFVWEKVNGAKSYNVELYDSNGALITSRTVEFGDRDTGQPNLQFDYPLISQPAEGTQNISYTWKVQTCADKEGKRCGPNWASQYFVINRVSRPTLTTPKTEFDSLKGMKLAWDGKTKFNLVTITYSGASTQEGCSTGTVITSYRSTDDACSMDNGCVPSDIKASCAGTYGYKIQPCVDPNCSDRGEQNALTGTFTVGSTQESSSLGNFTVCGQSSDNLDTSWDESADCSIGSVFLLVKLMINFLIFKLAFIILPILMLISGGMFYLGMKGKDTIPTIKKLWKYVGIGYAIMLMAWFIVSWLIALTGYQGIAWYQVF